jgi:hypothetical protein
VDTLRELLRAGYDVNTRIRFKEEAAVESTRGPRYVRLVHFCLAPRQRELEWRPPPPQLQCLEVLVREFGASINSLSSYGTPLHSIPHLVGKSHRAQALNALLSLGANVKAVWRGETPIFPFVFYSEAELVRVLLAHGASPNTRDSYDRATPLMSATGELVPLLLSVSSPQTIRARDKDGDSALDRMLQDLPLYRPFAKWPLQAVAQMLAAGVPIRRRNARRLRSHALAHAARQDAELRRRVAALTTSWRAHEAFVNLAFDFYDLRAAEEGVRRREARVAELEEELRALGVGTEDTEEDEDEDDAEEDDGEVVEEEVVVEAETGFTVAGLLAALRRHFCLVGR